MTGPANPAPAKPPVEYARFEPVLLKYVREKGSNTLAFYRSHAGYEAAQKVLTSMKPQETIDLVKASGLRGRGGAGFPTGSKWDFVPKQTTKPKYLVCNADESEPGTFKDRVLLENDPHGTIEGCLIAAYAIGSSTCYIYIRGEFGLGYRRLQAAIDEAYEAGILGKNIFGTGFNLDITVHRGAGAYICGEETGLLSSLEGKRGYPKIKPPFPAVEGLFGCPTVINNVETLATLPHIVSRGVAWFKSMGTEKSPGPKIFGISGKVNKPGLYELPLATPVRVVVEMAGGVRDHKVIKGVVPGGSSSGVLTPAELDTPLDFESIGAKGLILGTACLIVLDEDDCMVDALWNLQRFYHHESCGQCTPCREGTGWIEKVLARLERGQGQKEDVDRLVEVANNMCGRTICAFADGAAIPVRAFIERFKDEFLRHVTEKKCPFKMEQKTVAYAAH
jgi:NADH-quinone oxidoreductase subunit F